MASISQIKLPNNSVYDIKAKYDISGNIISDTYLRKDFDSIGHNVSFNSSVDIDDLTAGTLLVTGAARFTNGLIGNLKGTASNVPWSGVTSKPTTLSGYGITDALSSSTKYALSDSVGGNALRAISDKNGKDIDSTYLKMFTSRGLGSCTGDGKYNYFKIATIKISTPYINRPIVFELSGRGKHFSLLSIRFNSFNTNDPSLSFIQTNNDTSYWIKKVDTSTWEVYGAYSEVWGICCLHRVTGAGADIGITINMTNIDSLPSECIQATPGGSAGYATQAVQDGNGNIISSTYLPLSGGTMTGTLNILGGDRTSYSEGIRMHVSSLDWTAMVLCGSDNTGNTGTSAKTWGVYNHDGLFYITKNGSTTGTAQLSCVDDNVWRVNGNILLHAGNYSSYALPLSGGTITGTVIIKGTTTNSNSYGSTNPKIRFDNVDSSQNLELVYTDYDIVQKPSSLTLIGNQGGEYFIAPNIKATGNFYGSLSGNASTATKATQDGAGNVITSKYVTIDTTQTISGTKTFSKEATISSATASTNKTTGALKVKGGIASEGQMSADKVMIGDKCTLEYDANLQCLNFVFT